MNKNQIVMASIGGVGILFSLVIAYLAFSAYSERSTLEEDLEIAKESIQRMNNAKIAPTETSVKAIDENRTKLTTWQESAMALATRGDAAPRVGLTDAALKAEMNNDAGEMEKLPGGVNGAIVAENFGFGFANIVRGDQMPDANPVKLAQVARQWADIKFFVKTLADCGVTELTGVTVVQNTAVSEQGYFAMPDPRRKGRKAPAKKVAEAKPEDAISEQAYTLAFLAKPAAFVRVLNAFATASRFVTVDQLNFGSSNDALARILGDAKEATTTAAPTRRGRGRRTTPEPAAETAEANVLKKGLVFDPQRAAPLTITMNVTTIDFGSQATTAAKTNEQEDEP